MDATQHAAMKQQRQLMRGGQGSQKRAVQRYQLMQETKGKVREMARESSIEMRNRHMDKLFKETMRSKVADLTQQSAKRIVDTFETKKSDLGVEQMNQLREIARGRK